MKKLLAGGTLAVLAFGGMIAGAAPASAHTPVVSADCGWVDVNLTYYSGAKVTVVIDGTTVEDTEFSDTFQGRYDGLALDAAHEWSVTVDAYDNDKFDWADSGSLEACEAPPVEEEPTPEPTVPPVTEEPSQEPSGEPTEPAEEPTDEASVAPVDEEPAPSPSPSSDEPPVLAATGATVGGAVAFAALLAAGGVALVWARKRMQNA